MNTDASADVCSICSRARGVTLSNISIAIRCYEPPLQYQCKSLLTLNQDLHLQACFCNQQFVSLNLPPPIPQIDDDNTHVRALHRSVLVDDIYFDQQPFSGLDVQRQIPQSTDVNFGSNVWA